jgi:hypothetical protein
MKAAVSPAPENPSPQSVDEWSVALVNWLEPYSRSGLVSLAEDLSGLTGINTQTEDGALSLYVIFGARTEMPFSIYERLQDKDDEESVLARWTRDTCRRRTVIRGRYAEKIASGARLSKTPARRSFVPRVNGHTGARTKVTVTPAERKRKQRDEQEDHELD